jgi:hypothetical protein
MNIIISLLISFLSTAFIFYIGSKIFDQDFISFIKYAFFEKNNFTIYFRLFFLMFMISFFVFYLTIYNILTIIY